MKLCRHLHIYGANMYMQKLRARGQSLLSYFPLYFLMAFVYSEDSAFTSRSTPTTVLLELFDIMPK